MILPLILFLFSEFITSPSIVFWVIKFGNKLGHLKEKMSSGLVINGGNLNLLEISYLFFSFLIIFAKKSLKQFDLESYFNKECIGTKDISFLLKSFSCPNSSINFNISERYLVNINFDSSLNSIPFL